MKTLTRLLSICALLMMASICYSCDQSTGNSTVTVAYDPDCACNGAPDCTPSCSCDSECRRDEFQYCDCNKKPGVCEEGRCACDPDCEDPNAIVSGMAPSTNTSNDPLCNDSCAESNDTYCDDGGPNSDFDGCAFGTDCTDCGQRQSGDENICGCVDLSQGRDCSWCTCDPRCTDDESACFPECTAPEICQEGACVAPVTNCDPDNTLYNVTFDASSVDWSQVYSVMVLIRAVEPDGSIASSPDQLLLYEGDLNDVKTTVLYPGCQVNLRIQMVAFRQSNDTSPACDTREYALVGGGDWIDIPQPVFNLANDSCFVSNPGETN